MRASVRDFWMEFNEPLEGRLSFMYLDVKGLVSTGVGNRIDASRGTLQEPTASEREASHAIARRLRWLTADGDEATAEQIDSEWDLVKSRTDLAPRGGGSFAAITSLRLPDDEIERLVFSKLDEMEGHLRRRTEFSSFDSWPADAQLGVLSMSWGMGPAFRFPRFQAFVSSDDWEGAATECRFNPEIGTIVIRNDRNQKLFRNAARVVARDLDREALVFPADAADV
ncbi:hypothetical protein WJ438_09985 [Streptomyces sp. GD-15H]|uniref:hypothetical protein n=1 Tax=Streptomyces sp. GD-15H TaxID=3129112 RepID=UPI0032514F4B